MVEPAAADAAAWALPGAPADDHARAAPSAPAAPSPTPSGGTPAVASALAAALATAPPVPVPLRAMTLTDRLDGAFRILKLAPGTVLTLAVLAVLPVQLASVALAGSATEREGWELVLGPGLFSVVVDDSLDLGPAVVLATAHSIGLSFIAAGLASLVAGWYVGRPSGTGEVLALAARRLPALIAAWVMVHAAELAFGLVFVVPALLPMMWFSVVAPVIAVEGTGPVEALRRSHRLTKRSLERVGGTVLAVAAVDLLLRVLLGIVVLSDGFDGLPGDAFLSAAIGITVQLLVVPFVAGAAALLYVDLRVRTEGIDIELAVVERFPSA